MPAVEPGRFIVPQVEVCGHTVDGQECRILSEWELRKLHRRWLKPHQSAVQYLWGGHGFKRHPERVGKYQVVDTWMIAPIYYSRIVSGDARPPLQETPTNG